MDELVEQLWNTGKMVEEKAGVQKQNSKNGIEKMSMPAASSVESFFLILDSTAVPYLKLAFSTRTNQNSSTAKLRQFRHR